MGGRRDELASGSMIGGYRIDDLISRGGMGVVYRATNLALGRIYALKVLAPELADDEHFRGRFKREIRIAASLHHPNVVAIHYAGEQDGLLFVAMDLIDGANLTEVIARAGKLDPERAVGLLEQIASALDAAHSKGLVHRDVKPGNILIKVEDGQERAYLTDFGLAKRFDAPTALTVPGAVVGTVDYMPPEQITGGHTDARSDVYAVGCVFFQMLTGKVPYQREHSVATLFAHVYDPPPSLEGSAASSHPTFGPVIAKAMAKDPSERYLSAGDLARDALAALEGVRYTGPPTIVGTGDARPVDLRESTGASDALAAMETAGGGTTFDGLQTEIRSAPENPAVIAGAPPQPLELRSPSPPPDPPPPPGSGEARTPPPAPAGPPAAAGSPSGTRNRRRAVALGVLVAAAAAAAVVAVVVASGSGKKGPASASNTQSSTTQSSSTQSSSTQSSSTHSSSSTPAGLALRGTPFGAALNPVPTNRVTASGSVTVRLVGDVATVTIHARGLLNAAPHAMHIHAGGLGECPPASAARPHNGHLTISTTNGIEYYGDTVVSLTTYGDTSPRSIIDFTRYPTTGTINYHRSIRVSANVAAEIRDHNAVVVIHGIDYNGNGIYDNVLDRSDLSTGLTAESTDPALCGALAREAGGAAAGAHASAVYGASLDVRDISMTQANMLWCDGGSTSPATAPGSDPLAFKRSTI